MEPETQTGRRQDGRLSVNLENEGRYSTVVEEEHGASFTQGTNSDVQRWSGRRLEKEGARQEDKGN